MGVAWFQHAAIDQGYLQKFSKEKILIWVRCTAIGRFWGVWAVVRDRSKVEPVTFTAIKRATELRLKPFQVHNKA